MTEEERTVESMVRAYLLRNVERIAVDLELLAKRVRSEATGLNEVGKPGRASYISQIANIDRAVKWGVANINIGGLFTEALNADLDRAERADK